MNNSENDKTRPDLGDDLLQTRTVLRPAPRESAEESIDELLLNSKILLNEGLIEDAKRTLRKVMKRDPGNLLARDRLEEIQKLEIKQLLGGDGQRTGYRRPQQKPPESDDPDSTLAALELELGPKQSVEEEFFKNGSERDAFIGAIEALCQGASAQDRIDLGIGFLEMEFFEVAIRQFEAAAKDAELEKKSRVLLATALIEKGRAFEAMLELESLIAHQDSAPEEKVDFGYLAGKAQEALGHYEAAVHWYRAVTQLEPQYRDVADRLKVCLKKCGNTPSSSSSPSSRS